LILGAQDFGNYFWSAMGDKAGLSKRQRVQMIRVAKVPSERFERIVERACREACRSQQRLAVAS
jgi:hypothetical protein